MAHKRAAPARSRRRALVIGGSLGGLFAAALLRRIGWDVTVFERVAGDLASRGAGIGTHPELFAVMRRIGLSVDDSIGVKVSTRLCLDRDGRVLHEMRREHVMSAWARLYRLLEGVVPADCCRFGRELVRFEQDAAGVTAFFADGSRATGELLVGADGIRSTVRAQLAPEAAPRYAGYVAWRGVAEESDIPPAIRAAIFERYTFCLPDGEMMLSYPVPGRDDDTRAGRRGYNFVWYRPVEAERALPELCTDASGRRHGTAIPSPLIRPDVIAALKADACARLAPQLAAIVERTAQPFFQPIFDLESPRMAFGRVALLGDAAFVARPHVGAGVTKAALDAQGLADAIEAADGDLDAALARYDRERRRFGDAIIARARHLGAHLEARRPAVPPPPADIVMREVGAPLRDIPELAGLMA